MGHLFCMCLLNVKPYKQSARCEYMYFEDFKDGVHVSIVSMVSHFPPFQTVGSNGDGFKTEQTTPDCV